MLRVTQILREGGLLPPFKADEFAMDRGTKVHRACELFDRRQLDWKTVDDRILGYVRAWQEFRQASRFEITHIEHEMTDAALGYGGRLDRAGILNGRRAILDIKTGQAGVWAGVQLAGYNRLLDPGAFIMRAVVGLTESGVYHLVPFTDKADFAAFDGALKVALWKQNHNLLDRRHDVRQPANRA